MDEFKVPILPPANAKVETTEQFEAKQPTQPQKQEARESARNTQEEVTAAQPTQLPPTYKVPRWSAPPPPGLEYRFEVLKSGQIIDEVKELQNQAIWMFGRLPVNNIEMAHPTISRFHAVLQYRPKVQNDLDAEDKEKDNSSRESPQPAEGWYIYDLDSTHGTFLNKQRVPACVYIRMRVGHMLRLGASTRSYILQGPAEDAEPESELSVTELRAQRQQQEAEAVAEAQRKAEEKEERERNEGISWGMTDDADEETDLSHNPYASTNNEELFLDDPKRTLRGYFEREGLALEYKCDEMSAGSFVCRVELPLDDDRGRPLIAEVVHKGRKKECVVQCALEACRILDRHGVLRQANQEPLKRKHKSKGSDSDDDEFWDRTGDIERKKQRKSNTDSSAALTYEDLLKKDADLMLTLKQVEADIIKYQETEKRLKAIRVAQEQDDDLDSYLENLSDDVTKLDKTEIRKLRMEQQRIKAEKQKLQRLIKLTKPIDLLSAGREPNLSTNADRDQVEAVKKQLPMVGKRNQFSKFKVVKLPTTATVTSLVTPSKAFASDEEEVEEEEKLQAAKIQKESTAKKVVTKEVVAENIGIAGENEKNNTNYDQAATKLERQYGPVETPKEIFDCKDQENSSASKTTAAKRSDTPIEVVEKSEIKPQIHSQNAEQNENEQNVKKRRPRQRQRNKRHEVDIEELDEHESSEKYAKWVPPENQSGDGYTKLNEKYGY